MAEQKKLKWSHRDVDLYFEGYEKREQVDPVTGKRRTEYVYTGDHYLFRLEPAQFIRYRIASVALVLGGTAAFLAANLLGPRSGMQKYVGLPALFSLVPLCYLLMGLWELARHGKPRMTIREYVFGMGRMKNTLWGVLLLWGVSLAGQVAYIIVHRDFAPLELGCAGLSLLAVGLLAVEWRLQRRALEACIHEAESKYDKRSED